MDYNHISHSHCWTSENPPCGTPLEKHTQCCLCDLKYPTQAEPHSRQCQCYGTGRWGANGSEECPGSPTQAGWREKIKRCLPDVSFEWCQGHEDDLMIAVESMVATARAEGAKLSEKHKTEHYELGKQHGAELERARTLKIVDGMTKKRNPAAYDFGPDAPSEGQIRQMEDTDLYRDAFNDALTHLSEEIKKQNG